MKAKRVMCTLFAGIACTILLGSVAKCHRDAHFLDDYDRGAPLNVVASTPEPREGYRRQPFRFDGVKGESVPALLALPVEPDGPTSCAVFLHGIGQKKEFLDEIAGFFTREGFAMATFDQYMRGERKLPKDTGLFKNALAFRRRAALTVMETWRLVDYLLTRPDIDPEGIYLLGASYGAVTGCTAVALDTRIRGAILTYGGGDLGKLLSSVEAKRELGRLFLPVRLLTQWLLAPAEPVRVAHRISPRPVLLQNGTRDRLIPVEAAKALHAAVQEPKTKIWYDSDHVGLDREHTLKVLGDAVTWLKKQEAERRK